MNRDQAVNIVASHLVTLVADASLEEVSGITRSGLDRMSTEELALLDDARQIVMARLSSMGRRSRPEFNPDLLYRAVVLVEGEPTVHGPYKHDKSAAQTGRMWARRVLQPYAPFGPYPAVSVQVQKRVGEEWTNVGDPIVEAAGQ